MAENQRVTIKKEYAEKIFFERVLLEWKQSIDDRNRSTTIHNALKGLQRYVCFIHWYF